MPYSSRNLSIIQHPVVTMTEEAQTTPAPVQRTIVERERVIQRFYGDDPTQCVQFEEDVRHSWASIPARDTRHRLDIIKTNAGPLVRAEITCMTDEAQKDPEQVLQLICKRFGERRSTSELLQILVGLHQGPGERVLEFSHRCKASFLDLTNRQKAVGEPVLPETTLINHFSRNVRDRQLAKYLKEKMTTKPGWTFSEVREAALEWSEGDEVEASAHAVNTSTTSEPSKTEAMMMEMLKTMQGQLSVLMSEREERRAAAASDRRSIRCYRCKKLGHYARNCSGN